MSNCKGAKEGGNSFKRTAKAWIDFNQNGVYEEPTELVATHIVGAGTATTEVTSEILIPADAIECLVGFRIAVAEGDTPASSLTPCAKFFYGGVKEFRVKVRWGIVSTGTFICLM